MEMHFLLVYVSLCRDGLMGTGGRPRETEQTAELDNRQLLQVQGQLIHEQDNQLDELEQVVQSTKHIAVAVNEELNLQTRLLDGLEDDVDHVQVCCEKRCSSTGWI